MAKKTVKQDNQVIRVANTDIVIGQTYEIIGKKDMDAPEGFQQFNTTKYLIPGIAELHSVPFSETNNLWDSGFYVHSDCNKSMHPTEKEALVKLYNEYIRKPFEEMYRVDTSESNDDFWSTYIYEIYTNKPFDTTNVKDRFDLFHALKQGKVCEVGERDAILQRSANYCIRNIEKAISLQEERANNKFDAITKFSVILDGTDLKKDDTLYTILEWMNFSTVRGADKDTIRRLVQKAFENEKTGYDTALRFLEALRMSEDKDMKKEMEIFSILSKLNVKRKLEYKRQQYYLNEELLGNTLKASAKSALMNPDKLQKIMEEYEKIE